MTESRSPYNTMTEERVGKLMGLVRDSNTAYLLVSGGGEGYLEPGLMNEIVEQSEADLTWLVTSAIWARSKASTKQTLDAAYEAFRRGNLRSRRRRVCIRVSVDTAHVERLARDRDDPLGYVANVVEAFDARHAADPGFFLQLHSIEGEEELIHRLCTRIAASVVPTASTIHADAKRTETAIRLRRSSGYEFEVTFAKLLLSDLAANLHDQEAVERRIDIWERDAYVNERGFPGVHINADGPPGTDMLVIYDGRVAGAWQCEMPDVAINVDIDSYDRIMEKTLSDPGVLATMERGLRYRFDVIDEVCPKASTRAKAVNIRDYTSPVLLEEDTVRAYYSLRAVQDFLHDGRIETHDIDSWPSLLRGLVLARPSELQDLFRNSGHDIVRQFAAADPGFATFLGAVMEFGRRRDAESLVSAALVTTGGDGRRLDKWRLLFARIRRGWYDIASLGAAELAALSEAERVIDTQLLGGRRVYEGLSQRP